jgi:hypothetical protein
MRIVACRIGGAYRATIERRAAFLRGQSRTMADSLEFVFPGTWGLLEVSHYAGSWFVSQLLEELAYGPSSCLDAGEAKKKI